MISLCLELGTVKINYALKIWLKAIPENEGYGHHSQAKIFFQSFFILITVQPCFLASSYSPWVENVPTLVSGSHSVPCRVAARTGYRATAPPFSLQPRYVILTPGYDAIGG